MKTFLRQLILALGFLRLAFSAPFPINVPFDPVQKMMNKFGIQNSKNPIQNTNYLLRNDFLINDDIIGGSDHEGLSMTIDGSGNFVVGWHEFRDGDADCFGQRLNISGSSIGQNFRINRDATMLWQGDPAIAMHRSGSFIAAWEDRRNGNSDVFIQRYDNNGTPIDTSFQANDDGTGQDQRGTAAIVKPDGEFIVVWEDWRNDWGDIYGQRFSANGSPIGSNFKVNSDIGGTQYGASIAEDSLGNFVVVWMDGRNSNWDIYGQRYNNQAVPQGSNFRVNDDVGSRTQWAPSVAAASNGNFVVTWEDQRYDTLVDIWAQRYNANGTLIGTNFQVNDVGTNSQNSPVVGFQTSNYFIIVWTDARSSNYDIYFRRYDASGNPLGSSILVNDDGGIQNQTGPQIVVNPNDDFWLAWSDARNFNTDVYVQHYNSSGSPIGDNYKINDDAASSQQRVSMIAIDGKGIYDIIWEDERNGINRTDIYLQRIDSIGNSLASNIRVNDDAGSAYQFYSTVAAGFTGNFLTAWTDGRNASYDIYAQRFDAIGNRINNNFRVNDDLVNAHQWYPWAAMDSAGNGVIVWMDTRDDNNYDIFGQRYDNNGNPAGANFKVNDVGTGYQAYGSVAQNRAGNLVVTWMDNRDGDFNIYGQRFDASGNAIGSNFRIDDDGTGSDQGYPAVAIDRFGNFVVVWEDDRNDNNTDIYGQIYNSYGQRIGDNFRIVDDITDEDQYSPSVYMSNDGRFIVVWSDWRGGKGDPDLYGQRFFTNGIRIGDNTLINQPDTFSNEHQWTIGQSVAANNNCIGFAWTDNRRHKGFDIYGKMTDWNLIGINEEKIPSANELSSFTVYPNPTNGKITIKFGITNHIPARIYLYDVSGRQRQSVIVGKNRGDVQLRLTNLAKGIYFVVSGQTSQKVILK
jgi:Secretion system C-terminal sorting domain